jgi:hypothetical protein
MTLEISFDCLLLLLTVCGLKSLIRRLLSLCCFPLSRVCRFFYLLVNLHRLGILRYFLRLLFLFIILWVYLDYLLFDWGSFAFVVVTTSSSGFLVVILSFPFKELVPKSIDNWLVRFHSFVVWLEEILNCFWFFFSESKSLKTRVEPLDSWVFEVFRVKIDCEIFN